MSEQAATPDVVTPAPVLTFQGRQFRAADKFGLMPLLKFAHVAKKGMDSADMEALAVVYDVLAQAIHPEDWDAFCDHATEVRAETDDLLEVVSQAIEVMTARPTGRSSESSDGPTTTSPSSPAASSSQVFSTRDPRHGPVMDDPRVRSLRLVSDPEAVLATA